MNYYLIYSYEVNDYQLIIPSRKAQLGNAEVLFEFASDEVGIAQKILSNLQIEHRYGPRFVRNIS